MRDVCHAGPLPSCSQSPGCNQEPRTWRGSPTGRKDTRAIIGHCQCRGCPWRQFNPLSRAPTLALLCLHLSLLEIPGRSGDGDGDAYSCQEPAWVGSDRRCEPLSSPSWLRLHTLHLPLTSLGHHWGRRQGSGPWSRRQGSGPCGRRQGSGPWGKRQSNHPWVPGLDSACGRVHPIPP